MVYRNLGRTGLKVSPLCFGCMTFGGRDRWMGGVGDGEAERMVKACLDAGVNLFDTADVYNIGQSEIMLGKALGPRRREAVIATKVFCRMGRGPNAEGLSRHHILDAADASLKRLDTDWIDLYQVHEWDSETPLEETLRALEDLVRWGKVRYLGASNFAAWQFARALWAADKNGWARFESNQVQYSLLQRRIEDEMVPLAQHTGAAILAWSPLAGGWLSGKYRGEKIPHKEGRFSEPASRFPFFDPTRARGVTEVLEKVASVHKVTPAQAALSWLLAKPWVASVVFGATGVEQVRENLRAAEVALSRDGLQYLDKISAAHLN